jgi:hypothetical protein
MSGEWPVATRPSPRSGTPCARPWYSSPWPLLGSSGLARRTCGRSAFPQATAGQVRFALVEPCALPIPLDWPQSGIELTAGWARGGWQGGIAQTRLYDGPPGRWAGIHPSAGRGGLALLGGDIPRPSPEGQGRNLPEPIRGFSWSGVGPTPTHGP